MFKEYFNNRKYRSIFDEIKSVFFGYLKAQLVIFVVNVFVITAGLLFLDMKWWSPLIAVGTSLLDLLPVLGSGAVFVPWVIYCFYQGDYKIAIGLIILFVILLLLKLVLEPIVCGKKIGLSGLETFGAAIIGMLIFGGSGIVVGPLLAVILKVVMKYIGEQPQSQ